MTHEGGYTLVEPLLVITLIAILLAVAVPRIPTGATETQVRASAREMAATLRAARGQAINSNKPVPFVLDTEKRTYRVGDGADRSVPLDIAVSLLTARSELVGGETGNIRFFPDGSSTGGRIRLKRPGRKTLPTEIVIDWISGRVTVAE